MANSPPTYAVTRYKGSGQVEVYPLLPTQILGSQDGSDVGTGGPGLPSLETPNASSLTTNRNVEFLDDRYCLIAPTGANAVGVYKKNQPTSGQWGRVMGGGTTLTNSGAVSGLFVLHPLGVPTLCFLMFDSGSETRLFATTDGTTGADWGTSAGKLLETSGAQPNKYGQAVIYRDSVFWLHSDFTGGAGNGHVTSYDLALDILTRYSLINIGSTPVNSAFQVHKNKLFACGNRWNNNAPFGLMRLDAGVFNELVEDTGTLSPGNSHNLMFTDPASGDLVVFTGSNGGTKVRHVVDAESVNPAVLLTITGTILGSGEGADKYIGTGLGISRQWIANVDTDSDPANPRTFLTTWVPGGVTETWEWKGIAAEIEAVALLAGISDDFALPYNTVGGGMRSPRTAAVEIGDASNAPTEVPGGTRIYFRGRGSVAVGVVTFYGTDSEGTPNTVIPIFPGTLTGVGPSTPTISGNTLINFTPDDGATLYSVALDVAAAGVDIGEGDVGLIIPRFV